MLQGFLNNAAAVHLERERENMSFHMLGENRLLGLIAVLKELLDYIVAKDIRHQLEAIG